MKPQSEFYFQEVKYLRGIYVRQGEHLIVINAIVSIQITAVLKGFCFIFDEKNNNKKQVKQSYAIDVKSYLRTFNIFERFSP